MNITTIIDLLERSVNMQTNNLTKVLKTLTWCTGIYCAADVLKTIIPYFF